MLIMTSRTDIKRAAFLVMLLMYLHPPSFAAAQSTAGTLTGEMISAIIQKAKQGDHSELVKLLHALEKSGHLTVSKDAAPLLTSLLREEASKIQLVATKALYLLGAPSTGTAIVAYLEGKDFGKLEEQANRGEISEREYGEQIKAATYAILTLGQLGDKSVVPLLKSLCDVEDLKFEFGGGPAQQALAELGAVEPLVKVPDSADHREKEKAAVAVARIRDPQKVPELMATVRDPQVAAQVRHAALSAITEIDAPGTDEFLRGLLEDPDVLQSLQKSAAVAAGKVRAEELEPLLLSFADGAPSSSIRPHALVGLALMNPDLYLPRWFQEIMDPEEDLAYRKRLVSLESCYPRSLLMRHRKKISECLTAATVEGKPVDKIRVEMWILLHELFGDRPRLVLSSASERAVSRLRHPVETQIMMNNPHLSAKELREQTEALIRDLVVIHDEVK